MDTHTFFNDGMYQDDAHDGALCVSKVYPDLLLNVSYPYGPGWLVEPGGPGFESFRVLELLQDSDDEERQELGRRAMMRTLAPQTTASFVYMMNDGKHPDDESFGAMMRNASAVCPASTHLDHQNRFSIGIPKSSAEHSDGTQGTHRNLRKMLSHVVLDGDRSASTRSSPSRTTTTCRWTPIMRRLSRGSKRWWSSGSRCRTRSCWGSTRACSR
jgi:hypothetical protein